MSIFLSLFFISVEAFTCRYLSKVCWGIILRDEKILFEFSELAVSAYPATGVINISNEVRAMIIGEAFLFMAKKITFYNDFFCKK